MPNLNFQLTKDAVVFFKNKGLKINYKKGQLFVRPEDHAQGVYYLINGQALLQTIKLNGTEQIIGFWEKGAIFGKVGSVITQLSTDSYIQALTDCLVYRLSLENFQQLLTSEKQMYQAYMQQVSFNNIFTLNQIMVLGEKNSYFKVVSQLLLLASYYGNLDQDRCTLRVALTQEQLANMVCITREYLSKTLKKIRAKKLIEINKNGQINITRLSELRKELEK